MQNLVMPGTVISPETERIASLRAAAYDIGAMPEDLSFLEWVHIFEKFVSVAVENGGYVYHLDEKAPAGDYTLAAKISCAVLNALPADMRAPGEPVATEPYKLNSDAALAPATPCQDQARWNTYFWGGSLYMNHCLIQDVNAYVGNAAKVGTLLTAALAASGVGLPASLIIAAVSTFLAVNAAWLVQADNHCGGSGAFLQIPWISIGTPFVKQNC